MKILIVTQYFWPENFRINDLASELVKRGHQVTILTGKPNYPSGAVFQEFRDNPSGFNEYGGCEVIRVPLVPRGKGSSIKLALNYISYAITGSLIGLYKLRKKKIDVVFIFQVSPITLATPGVLYKLLYKKPIVMWVLDLWPESLQATGATNSKTALNFVNIFVKFIYKHCDLILGQSRGFVSEISKNTKQPDNVHYFPNWAESQFSEIKSNTTNKDKTSINFKETSTFNILFAGNIGVSQDFPSIINAAEILKKDNVPAKIIVLGDGRDYLKVKNEVETRNLGDYIVLLGRHPLESMPHFYKQADAFLVSLKDEPIFHKTIPGKVQSYMAFGKPILSMLTGEGSRVIQEARCGLTADSGDFKSLANNITIMINYSPEQIKNLSNNALNYSDSNFNKVKLINKLETWFSEATSVSE